MSLSNSTKSYIKLVVISLVLLAGLVSVGIGCTGFDQWTSPASPPAEEPAEVEKPPPATVTTITTEDRAILVVYEHLLSQAESYQAKAYLADFYTACDNWEAKSELLKDGTIIWNVTVDMTDAVVWQEKPYWKQATWLVLEDGKVIPSNSFQANALRIEADLQELSLQPEPPPTQMESTETETEPES